MKLSVTFFITGSREARSTIFHGRNQLNKEDHSTSFTETGDKRGHVQRHVTSTNEVTRDSYCVELDIFDIFDLKNLHNKKNHHSCVIRTRDTKGHAHGHVTLTYKVTRDSCCVEFYIFDIPDPKNLQNKNKIITLASLEQEIRKITFRVTRPWRTGSRLQ